MPAHTRTFITGYHLILAATVILAVAFGVTILLPFPMNMIPFGVIGGVLLTMAVIKFPFVGVFLYLIIFFFKPHEQWAVPIPYERIVALLIIGSLAIRISFVDKKFQIYPLDKALGAFVFLCGFSVMFGGDFWLGWNQFFDFFKIFLVYIFVTRLADTPKRFRIAVWIFVLSIGYLAFMAIKNYYSGGAIVRSGIHRAIGIGGHEGSYGDPNSLANTINLGVPFIFFLIRYYRRFLIRLVLVAFGLMSVWTVIITGSRGGMLSLIFVGMVIAFTAKNKVLTGLIAVVVAAGTIAVMPGEYRARFMTIIQFASGERQEVSAQGRINGLVYGLKFMVQRPLTGAGIGNFRWMYARQAGSWSDAHNLIGKLAGELAVPGMVIFGYFLYLMFKSVGHIKKKYKELNWNRDFLFYTAQAIWVSLLLLLFQGLTGHNLFRFNWYINATFIVIMLILMKRRLASEPEEGQAELAKGESPLPEQAGGG